MRALLLVALALSLALGSLPCLAQTRPNVLFVFAEDKELPGMASVHRSLQHVFRTGLHDEVELYSESLQFS